MNIIPKSKTPITHSSQCSTPEELNKYLNTFDYGTLNTKGIIDMSSGWVERYRTMSPQQFEQNHGGICWDYVAFESWFFQRKFPYKYELFFMQKYNRAKTTHTFLLYEENDSFRIFESSWGRYQGIHHYPTRLSAITLYITKFINYKKDLPYILLRYKQPTRYGMTSQEYLNYVYDHSQIVMNYKNMLKLMTGK